MRNYAIIERIVRNEPSLTGPLAVGVTVYPI